MTEEINKQIVELWDIEKYCSQKSIHEAASLLFGWLETRDDDISQLLVGRHKGPFPKEVFLYELETKIIKHFRPNRETVNYLNALAMIVDRGNRKELFDICLPGIPTLMKLEKSPFLEENMAFLPRARLWRQKVRQDFYCNPIKNFNEYIGRLLCSAALNGGLINSKMLTLLCPQASHGLEVITPPHSISTMSFLFFEVPISKHSPPEKRRWFPDPLSEILILTMPDSVSKKIAKLKTKFSRDFVFGCIKSYLIHSGLQQEDLPSSISDFLNAISFELHLKLPPFLINYAQRSFISHSVKPHTWQRLYGLMTPCKDNKATTIELETYDYQNTFEHEHFEHEHEKNDNGAIVNYDWMMEIKSALTSKNDHILRLKMKLIQDEYAAVPYSIENVLAGWVLFMLNNTSFYGNKLGPTTIHDYVLKILNKIVGIVGEDDITLLEGEGIEEMYIQILEDIESESSRKVAARAIREFHYYLTEEFHLAPINYREVLGIGTKSSSVDANIISFQEYRDIHDLLKQKEEESPHPIIYRIARLLFILAFKCGLRRSEAFKLEIIDFQDLAEPELIIRDNDHRRVKTKNSIRRYPLKYFLEEDEFKLLCEWKKKRLTDNNQEGQTGFLFAIPELLYDLVPERKIFNIIRDAMHVITKDSTLRYHHLRHSFGSWLFFNLALEAIEPNIDNLSFLPVDRDFLNQAQKCANNFHTFDGPTRKYLYTVSSFLGHSGPAISLEHYLHLCDVSLKVGIDTHLADWDLKSLLLASGLPSSTTYRWLSGDDLTLNETLARIRNKTFKKDLQKINTKMEAPAALLDEPDEWLCDEAAFLKRLRSFLFLKSLKRLEDETVQRRLILGLLPQRKITIEARATRGSTMKPKSQRGYRHRIEEHVPDKRFPEKFIRTLAPIYPRLKRDQEVFNNYAPRVWKMFEVEPVLTRKILKLFMTNTWHTRNELIFHGRKGEEIELARDYLKFLKSIHIGKNKIRFLSYDDIERSKERRLWKRHLNLSSRDRIHSTTPTNKKSNAVRLWLGIKPVLFEDKKCTEYGSAGFRFLMNMMALYAEYRDQ